MKTLDTEPEKQVQKKISTKSNSANSYGYYEFRGIKKVLFNLAQKLPKNTFGFKTSLVLRKLTLQNRIETVDEIQPFWLQGKRRIGVTAGASTDEQTISEVLIKLEAIAQN